jgi:hypothetical protein
VLKWARRWKIYKPPKSVILLAYIYYNNVVILGVHAAFIFTLKMEAVWPSETLVSYHTVSQPGRQHCESSSL